MKKRILIGLCAAFVMLCVTGLAIWFFGLPGGVRIDYNSCTVYSQEDIDSAAAVIIEKMDSMEGCVLYSLKYGGNDELDYCRSLNEQADYVESIIFDSVFRSPITGGGAWEANAIYTWQWHLAREEGGQWELLTWGYA